MSKSADYKYDIKPWRKCKGDGGTTLLELCDEAWLTREKPRTIEEPSPVMWCNACDHWHVPPVPPTEVKPW